MNAGERLMRKVEMLWVVFRRKTGERRRERVVKPMNVIMRVGR